MSALDMEDIFGKGVLYFKHLLPIEHFYLVLRQHRLPYSIPAQHCYHLAKLVKKHGAFDISTLCRRMLMKAKPLILHKLFREPGKIPGRAGTAIKFRRYDNLDQMPKEEVGL